LNTRLPVKVLVSAMQVASNSRFKHFSLTIILRVKTSNIAIKTVRFYSHFRYSPESSSFFARHVIARITRLMLKAFRFLRYAVACGSCAKGINTKNTYQLLLRDPLWHMMTGVWQSSDASLLMSDGYLLVFMDL
jgi:hypothetical protein